MPRIAAAMIVGRNGCDVRLLRRQLFPLNPSWMALTSSRITATTK
jgi:hypothetical protein